MADDLSRFARTFSTEAVLQQAIADLLRRMPNTSGVHVTQGTTELGKDIVFYSYGPLQERQLFACVVKNTPITGDISALSGAATVLNQSTQALENPYHSPSGDFDSVAHVYVMSPHEIGMAAMNSITGGLRARAGQVTFKCGGRLLELFKEHWPEYLVFESGALGTYAAQLLRDLDKDDPIAALASRNSMLGAMPQLRSVYVRQNFGMELRAFHSSAMVPTPHILQNSIPITLIDRVKDGMVSAAHLVAKKLVYKDIVQDDSASQCASILLQVAVTLKDRWNKAYVEYVRSTPPLDVRPKHEALIKIDWPEEEWNQITEALTRAALILEAFEKRLASSNTFALSTAPLYASALHDSAVLDCCTIKEVAKLAPAVLTSETPPRSVVFASTLLDDHPGTYLITASAGYGKTSFCKWHASLEVSRLADKKSNVLPIYIPLYQLATRQLGTFEEEFFPTTELRKLVHDTSDASAKRIKKIRIYLDGLDEVSRADRRREIMGLASAAMASDSRIEVIVTARDYVSGDYLEWMPRININEFTPEQADELVVKLLESDDDKIRTFRRQLLNTAGLSALMHVPLLATLIVSVFRNDPTSALPSNRVTLYNMFVELMCGGWDIIKNVRRDTQFGSVDKIAVLTALAGRMHLNGIRECKQHEFNMAVKDSGIGQQSKAEPLLNEVLQDGLLTKVGAGYMFAHLSFQEYLSAKGLGDPTGKRPLMVLRHFLKGNDWWAEVLSFYVGLCGRPDEVWHWIEAAYSSIASGGTEAKSSTGRLERLWGWLRDSYPGLGIKRQV